MTRPLALTILFCLASVACESDISSASRLRRLRLLAVQAEPVSPRYGTSTTLRPLVYVPVGEEVSYQWSWCPVPTSSDEGFACPLAQPDLDRLAADAGLVGVPPLDLGAAESVELTNPFPPELLARLCAGDSTATALFLGGTTAGKPKRVYSCAVATLPMQIMLTIRGSTTDTGVISLRLPTDQTTLGNQNPIITGLNVLVPEPAQTLDEAGTVVVPRDTKVKLLAGVDPAQAETYVDWQIGPDNLYLKDGTGQLLLGPTSEQLYLNWYSQGGGFETRKTGWNARVLDADGEPVPFQSAIENDWTTPDREDFPDAPSTLLVVVRDNRGGVAWTRALARLAETP